MFGWVVFKSGLYLCRWSGKLAMKMLYVLIRKKKNAEDLVGMMLGHFSTTVRDQL